MCRCADYTLSSSQQPNALLWSSITPRTGKDDDSLVEMQQMKRPTAERNNLLIIIRIIVGNKKIKKNTYKITRSVRATRVRL